MNREKRSELVREILADADPRELAKKLSKQHGLDFGRVWLWVLEAAQRSAVERLPVDGLIERLLDRGERARLLADVTADRTLVLGNRLHELLPTCEATPEQLLRLIAMLPADGSEDSELDMVVYHPSVTESVLFELLDQGRFISALGHRRGPRELLERLAERHQYAEAVTTLALYYYGCDDYPLERFLDFVRRHRSCAMLEHNLRSASFSPERQRAVIALLDGP